MPGQEFVEKLETKGVQMAFAVYEEPKGCEMNLIYEKGQFFLMNTKERTLKKVPAEVAVSIIQRLNDKSYRVTGAGQFKQSVLEGGLKIDNIS